MKKSKKFILAVLVVLVAAIAVVLMNPDWFDNGDKIDTNIEIENVDEMDNPFDD
ncbi:MAG: hypothetical protein ACPGVD_02010 [Flavobacteriales bacterium]